MRIVVFVAVALLVLGAVASAQQISGTAHDLTILLGAGEDQVCRPCHTPHNAGSLGGAAGKGSVLWNHFETTAVFSLYDAGYSGLGAASKACLSCHDGVTAIDNYGGGPNTFGAMTGANVVGTDLQNDHPVGFNYSTYAIPVGIGGYKAAPDAPLKIFATTQVECGTCHDVHDDQLGNFLRITATGSAICLACHQK